MHKCVRLCEADVFEHRQLPSCFLYFERRTRAIMDVLALPHVCVQRQTPSSLHSRTLALRAFVCPFLSAPLSSCVPRGRLPFRFRLLRARSHSHFLSRSRSPSLGFFGPPRMYAAAAGGSLSPSLRLLLFAPSPLPPSTILLRFPSFSCLFFFVYSYHAR